MAKGIRIRERSEQAKPIMDVAIEINEFQDGEKFKIELLNVLDFQL